MQSISTFSKIPIKYVDTKFVTKDDSFKEKHNGARHKNVSYIQLISLDDMHVEQHTVTDLQRYG